MPTIDVLFITFPFLAASYKEAYFWLILTNFPSLDHVKILETH
ncbi:hypothetical protein XIS1_1370050 [Xenorhabdus innexi]|uniref:Uncharacterized protein n=1 Tax=Xenorhabdus innexi TaxID=290109 RepID=A0A1N6MTT2_9GAMM|nr:hypothetical protein XIS1_1370050 [Xenorhabdus innexi]